MIPTGLYHTSKEGIPIIIERPGMVEFKKLFKLTNLETLSNFYVHRFERIFNIVLPIASEIVKKRIDKYIVILDMKGLSVMDFVRNGDETKFFNTGAKIG